MKNTMHNTINEKDQTIFIHNEVLNEPVCIWKHKAFSNHKQDKEIFIETGTNTGNGIANALAIGFKTIYSIEIDPNNYNIAKDRWKQHKNVTILLGDTGNHIQSIIESISLMHKNSTNLILLQCSNHLRNHLSRNPYAKNYLSKEKFNLNRYFVQYLSHLEEVDANS